MELIIVITDPAIGIEPAILDIYLTTNLEMLAIFSPLLAMIALGFFLNSSVESN